MTERETRRRPAATANCPRCHRKVTLWEETNEWDRHGKHLSYGPAVGECDPCSVGICDYWDGTFCFELPRDEAATT